jgi:hypothetical protein
VSDPILDAIDRLAPAFAASDLDELTELTPEAVERAASPSA